MPASDDDFGPRRVTDRGYHLGRTPANKGKKYGTTKYEADELLKIINAVRGNGPASHRHRALLAFLWRTGVRVIELPAIRLGDLNEAEGTIRVRRQGQRTREVFMVGSGTDPAWGWMMLRPWLDARERLNIASHAPLFCIAEGSTKGHPLGAPSVRMLVKTLAADAGLHGQYQLSSFRGTLAAELYLNNVSVSQIQRQLGHTSLSTTQTYLERLGVVDETEDLRNYRAPWNDHPA
jgi:site-specific recombinase XerD